jgi:hypothetical protein
MVKKNLNWFLPVLAIALMSMGQLFAQDTELTSIKVADDKAADKDACDKGCSFDWGEDTWLTVGAGLRTSYSATRTIDGSVTSAYDNNFNIDNARIYLNGRGHDCIGFEFNLDVNNAQGFTDEKFGGRHLDLDASDMRILDAIVKFEFNDLINIWMGRMIPPSDRANLSGPFYQNAGWDFPFTQFGYQEIFQGRDDGAALWGQLGGGAVKYQIGVYEGTNSELADNETQNIGVGAGSDDLLLAGRFTVNLLDPESGYYNASTYHGEKDILAIGYAFHHQNDAIGLNQYRAYNFDVLFETTLGNGGVVTAAGAYYDTTGAVNAANNGRSYMVEASYLTAREFALGCCVSGKIAPFWRHQEYTRDLIGVDRVNDWGFHYVMYGHNARVTYNYSDADLVGGESETHQIGVQLQY